MQTKNQLYTFLSLFLVLVIDMMGTSITLPVLATLFSQVNGGILPEGSSLSYANVLYGITNSAFFVFLFFGSPLMGDLSDQLGRKKVLVLCLLGAAAGFLISGLGILLKNIPLLILGRGIGGFATGCQAIATAAIVDMSTHENKTKNLSLITLAICIGFVIGPMIGGYFSDLVMSGLSGYALPFWIATILAFINAIALYFSFQETRILKTKQRLSLVKAMSNVKIAFIQPSLRRLSFAFLMMQLGWSIYFQYISLFLAQVEHYSASQIGLFMAYVGLVFSIALTLIIRVVVKRWTTKQIVIVSLLVGFISVLVGAFFTNITMQWIVAFPLALGMALVYTTFLTLFSNEVDQDSQGLVMGITASVASIAWIFGGLMISLLASMSLMWPFLFIALSWLLAAIVLIKHKTRKFEENHEPHHL